MLIAGYELPAVMKQIGVSCKVLAEVIGLPNDGKIRRARRLGPAFVPELIVRGLREVCGDDSSGKHLQSVVDIVRGQHPEKIEAAKKHIINHDKVQLTNAELRFLQTIASRHQVRIEISILNKPQPSLM